MRMTSRQRVRVALEHGEPDRVPIDLGTSRITGIQVWPYIRLREALGIDGPPPKVFDIMQMLAEVELPVLKAVGADVIGVRCPGPVVYGVGGDEYKPFTLFDGTQVHMPANFNPQADQAGNLRVYESGQVAAVMPYPEGHYFDELDQGLHDQIDLPTIEELTGTLKDLSDEDLRRIEETSRQAYESTDLAIMFEWCRAGLGGFGSLPDWLVVLATEKQFVADYFDAQVDYNERNLLRLCEAIGKYTDVIAMSGTDFGAQRGELFNPQIFKELHAPRFARMNEVVHKNSSMKALYHTCGSVRQLIPTFIETGCDILNPVQCSAAGMDPVELKTLFGDQLVFWGGGVDTQKTLPFGTPAQVRQEVIERIGVFAPGGGYVFNPVHNIQRDASAENLMVMYETARTAGQYPIAR